VLLRIARLLTAATGLVTGYRERADTLIEQAQAVVDRTSEQLTRTDAITASMDEVTANMAELAGRAAALAPLARMLAGGAGTPLARVSALVYGVHRAARLRRDDRAGAGRRASAAPGARAAARMLERGAASRQREEARR
jgi:hypothetical protein